LIHEEWEETRNAIRLGNIEKIADGLVDLLYVVIGAGVEYGIDLDAVWKEVHAANMRKDGGGVRDDGKIMKPVGWIGPNIRRALSTASTASGNIGDS
jgi:predicted HAD superfamily Cof-like phosphohydrolase